MASTITLRFTRSAQNLFDSIKKFCRTTGLRPPRKTFELADAAAEIANNEAIVIAIGADPRFGRSHKDKVRATIEQLNQDIRRHVAFAETDLARFGQADEIRAAAAASGLKLRSVISPIEDLARRGH